MVLRWVFRSEIDKAKEGISKLAIGLREGRALVVEASSTTAAAFRFTLGAATALAAGFFLSFGLDAIVLIGKWEILLAMVFYTSVLWALVSPILLIPRTMAGLAVARSGGESIGAAFTGEQGTSSFSCFHIMSDPAGGDGLIFDAVTELALCEAGKLSLSSLEEGSAPGRQVAAAAFRRPVVLIYSEAAVCECMFPQ